MSKQAEKIGVAHGKLQPLVRRKPESYRCAECKTLLTSPPNRFSKWFASWCPKCKTGFMSGASNDLHQSERGTKRYI